MDVVYTVLENIHAFIPVVAIIACLSIIYVWGWRNSEAPAAARSGNSKKSSKNRRKKNHLSNRESKSNYSDGQESSDRRKTNDNGVSKANGHVSRVHKRK